MGLFSSSYTTYVSSSVYNMAGDVLTRPNFLKSSLYSAVLNPYTNYIGEVLVGNYLTGPGIMQRSFFNWAVTNDVGGLPTYTAFSSVDVDSEVVKAFIPVPVSPSGLVTFVQSSELTDGNFTHWAERYIFENNPNEIGTDWVSDYNEYTHEITIQFVGGSTVVFGATNFDKNKQYIVARYYQAVPDSTEALVTGDTTYDVLSTPSTSNYSLDSTVNTGVVNHTLNQTVEVTKSYSNGNPTTNSTTYPSTVVGFNGYEHLYLLGEFVEGDGVSIDAYNMYRFYHVFERREVTVDLVGIETVTTNDLGGGVIETITTHTSGDFLTPIYDWREDSQKTIIGLSGGLQMYIYEIGTGEAVLDALQASVNALGVPEYYPFIPIRLNNVSITHPNYDNITGSGLYAEAEKAYKKATKGQSLLSVIEQVEATPSLGDIDYAYIQWGVSVNTTEESCRRYMYEFFRNMMIIQESSSTAINKLQSDVAQYNASFAILTAWQSGVDDSNSPYYRTPRPSVTQVAEPKTTIVRLSSDHPQLGGFDNRYSWISIEEEVFTGVGKVGAVKGEIWLESGSSLSWFTGYFSGYSNTASQVYMYNQVGVNTYKRLTIWGMMHENFIYGGKSVRTTLKSGIIDTEDSPFIVPLHAPTVKSLGIKNFTQMATANTWITFNSYTIVKKKWYESFFGMLLIIIAIVVVSVLLSPAASGSMMGVFGTNAAVGASLGLTGTTAIVAGAITNAIAAIVISQAISSASVSIFGEKWGAIIGAIASFAVTYGMSNGFSNLSISSIITPETLLKFSSALANGYSGFIVSENLDIQSSMMENQGIYDKAVKSLEDLMRSQGLINDLSFNPLALTDSVRGNDPSGNKGSYVPESLDEFINRTTMTGADIVDVTLSMVSDYSNLQLTLPKG